uniref:beta strand repeat-containing protein n=1 Tax=Altererythrobacter sp. TaxID=1872480 RepID=UPI003D044C46
AGDVFTYTATDANGNTVQGTITIDIVDDVPTASSDTDSVVEGALLDSGADSVLDNDEFGADGQGSITGVRAAGGDTTSDVSGGVGNPIVGLYGTLTLEADGTYSYQANSDVIDTDQSDVFVYTIVDADGDLSTTTLTIDLTAVTLTPDNDTQTVYEAALDTTLTGDDIAAGSDVGSDPTSPNETVTGTLNVTDAVSYTLVGSPAGSHGVIELNSDGTYTYTLVEPVDNQPHADDGNDTEAAGDVFTYTATDANGNTVQGTITIDIVDDVPFAATPDSLTGTNAAGSYVASLDTVNGTVDDNFGADGGQVIFTQASIDSLLSQDLTSGLAALEYDYGSGGTDQTVLVAYKEGTSTEVFRITLDPDGANDNNYVLEMSLPLDAVTNIDFNDGGYDFVGGNGSWAGFVPLGQDTDGGTPVDDDSPDLLLTPVGGDTVNTNANEGGVGSGNSVGSGEAMRVDYVSDLEGIPVPGGDYYGGDDTQSFDEHYTINGGSAFFTKITSSTTVTIAAFDDDDSGTLKNVGDGTPDDITSIAISYNGADLLVDTDGAYLVGGATFTVTFLGDGTVTVEGVPQDTRLAAFTDDGYNSIEWGHGGGNTFKIGDFGGLVASDDPVPFTVPISIVDGDGDTVDSGVLDITLNAAMSPVVLDLDGGGNAFSSLDAGIAYDYNGDGVKTQTAWIAAGSAILAYDANNDGMVTDASEFVFGGNGLTDLEAIAAKYDDNGDGKLDANDSAYGEFGVWIDADLDAVSDPGEFVSLQDAGIKSIDLVSDGETSSAADGDVAIAGTSSFTMDDGSTGEVSDAAFATAGDVDGTMEALFAMAAQGQMAPEGAPELADTVGIKSAAELPDVAAVLEDVMAGKDVDALIDHFAGDAGHVPAPINGGGVDLASYLGSEVVTHINDGGAFAFNNGVIADMHEDAAAHAAVAA